MSDLAQFKTFWDQLLVKGKARDEAFIRNTLPANVPEEALAFVMEMRANMPDEIAKHNVDPVFAEGSNAAGKPMVTVTLSYEEDGDTCTMEMPFFYFEDKWVSYDPDDPEFG